MDEQTTTPELDRRSLIKRAGLVAGATVWAAPTIQSLASPAFAEGSPAPGCPPSRTVKFKYDNVTCAGGTWGDNGNGGVCPPQVDGYKTAGLQVGANGCYGQYCVQIQLDCSSGEAKAATVRVTNGADLRDVDVKSGSQTGFCTDATDNQDGTFGINISQGISNIVGTFCLPD